MPDAVSDASVSFVLESEVSCDAVSMDSVSDSFASETCPAFSVSALSSPQKNSSTAAPSCEISVLIF